MEIRVCNCCKKAIPAYGYAVMILTPAIGHGHKPFLPRQELCKDCETEIYDHYQEMMKRKEEQNGSGEKSPI